MTYSTMGGSPALVCLTSQRAAAPAHDHRTAAWLDAITWLAASLALLASLLAVPLTAAPVAAQSSRSPSLPAQRTVGTILIAHGSDSGWNAEVERIARTANTGGPIAASFLMGDGARTHRFQDAVGALADSGVREIVVVPLLVSSHSGHYDQIRYLAGATDSLSERMLHHLQMSGIERPRTKVAIRLARALDDAPELARVLAERALELAKAPRHQALFLVGHGPNSAEDNARWMRNLRVVADSVRATTGFRDVRVGLVRDDAPTEVRAEAVKGVRELIGLQHELTGRPVVVVPVLISKGRVSREKFMADLSGLDIVYSGKPLLPSPELARWIESRVGEGMPGSEVRATSLR